jgi:hypothetical protein
MSKPLELVIFERIQCRENGCDCRGGKTTWLNPITGEEIDRSPDGRPNIERWDYSPFKRLTDAELAAEVHRQIGRTADAEEGFKYDIWDGSPLQHEDIEAERRDTINRFATHPHYDESPAT